MDRDCKVCGVTFNTKGPQAKVCSHECRLVWRRKRYKVNVEVSDRHRARVVEYNHTHRGHMLRDRALEKRRAEKRLPWYSARLIDIPEGLHDVRRLYWRVSQRVARERGGRKFLKAVKPFYVAMSAWRRKRTFTRVEMGVMRKLVREVERDVDRVLGVG